MIKNKPFIAYENDEEIVFMDQIRIHNGIYSLILNGDITLSKNKEGLNKALALKRVIDSVIDEMKRDKNFPYRE
jgi:hypothetical protein